MQKSTLPQRLIARPEFGPFVLLIILIIFFAWRSPPFLSQANISNFFNFLPEIGIITLGMTLLMTAGEFDLSVGAVFGFTPIVMWTLFNKGNVPFEGAFIIAMLLAVVIGAVNGWFVTKLRVPSFLVTLGMQLLIRGIALYITSGFPQGTWNATSPIMGIIVGQFNIGGFRIYMTLIWFILFAVILGYVLTQTRTGNWIQAAGGNSGAAMARGVRVGRIKVQLFILTSVLAAFAGVASSIRVSSANPNSGTGYELEVIAMVVIGGTALAGGRGTIIGTVIGVLILRVMQNAVVGIGVGLAYNIFIGGIILGMMALHSALERRHHSGV